jgi:hypothetical protein
MPSPCNNVTVSPIKVSQLVRYSNLDGGDLLLTVESGSSLLSRRSTINDLKNSLGRLTGSYSGSFTGSFVGVASGSFSGSYWGKVISKNTVSSGSFSGSYWGKVASKNTVASGSFSGSYWGSLVSKNTKATGSFRGSIVSTNTIASGSFSGSYWGRILSKNTVASGSFSGSHWGALISKNTKATGSFSGSHWGSLISKNTKATGSFSGTNSKLSGSFSGSYWGSLVSKNTKITGSFKGINNITNFRGSGKSVSVNATSSYSVYSTTSSYALTASYLSPIGSGGGSPIAFAFASWTGTTTGGVTPLSKYNVGSITRVGTQPTNASQNPGVYCDVLFQTPCIDANYTVLSYCSWNTPADISAGGTGGGTSVKFEGDLGTSVVSNRTANGFRVTVFTGWHAGTPGDGDDYYYNTAQFPDYNSFVVFR